MGTYLSQILTLVIFLLTSTQVNNSAPNKSIQQFENIVTPFLSDDFVCHVHIIKSPEIQIYFSNDRSQTTTFTLESMNLLNTSSIELFSNTFEFAPKIRSKNISIVFLMM